MAEECNPLVGGASCWTIVGLNFTISAIRYISAPTSFRLANPERLHTNMMLEYAPAQHLSEGRISCWQYTTHVNSRCWFPFLINKPPGTIEYGDGYLLQPLPWPAPYTMRLVEYEDGATTRSWDLVSWVPPTNEWFRLRISWWLSFGNLQVRVERWDGAAWIAACDDFSVAEPRNLDADWQRLGLVIRGWENETLYVDDAVITSLE